MFFTRFYRKSGLNSLLEVWIEGLPLFYALDRIFDMIRTTLNITGDAACSAVVDRFVKR
jgi:Na+/H+-dicarboxylate symporter